MVNLANTLATARRHHHSGDAPQAEQLYRQILWADPYNAEVELLLASACKDQGKLPEALAQLEHFEAAVRLQPDHAEAHKSLGMTLLYLGELERGWAEYEWRLKCKDFTPRSYPQPAWDGTALEGRRILVYTEQGLGDVFQFIRYVPLLAERGALVIVECARSMAPILKTCPGVGQVVAHGSPLPDFECHAPLMSLPRLFGTNLATIPANGPYLAAEPALVERWRRELKGGRCRTTG